MSKPKERYQPPGSIAVTREGVGGVVFTYTTIGGKPAACAYAGKAGRAAFHYTYSSEAARERVITQFFDGLTAHAKRKADSRTEGKQFQHGFKVGDILHYSWGYEQTNAEFYQVTAVNTATVTIRQIASQIVPGSEGFMSASVMPCPNVFLSEPPMTKHPQPSGNVHPEGYIRMDHGSATLHGANERAVSSWYA